MNITGHNLTGYSNSKGTGKAFKGFNPTTLENLEGDFYEASEEDVNKALVLASAAFPAFRSTSAEERALFLEAIALEIEAAGNDLITRAVQETALPEARITGERGRTTGQLRMFANLLREGSWVEATIETAQPERAPLPKPDLRNMLVPIGPVVVFSASNFPLAFSTAGGDTASALAAGNPVIVKAHSSHPGTSYIVARAVERAARKTNMPEGVFSHLFGSGFTTGTMLVKHPLTAAVAFTGSQSGGRALFDLASARENPIPVFAEMGSTNPVFVFAEAMATRGEQTAAQLAASVTQGMGQFCTKPGLIVVRKGAGYEKFENAFVLELGKIQSGALLNERIIKNYKSKIEELHNGKAITFLSDARLVTSEGGLKARPAAARVSAASFIANSHLHEELFGPYALIVVCENDKEMVSVTNVLGGQLTLSVFATAEEISSNSVLVSQFREKAGRLVFNGVPTGVEVCSAMQHGGPYPASTDSRFTSVGTKAILRFVRPVSFQNWPDDALPPELQNSNPKNILRLVNSVYTRNPTGK
jgi:2,5-dioxopentanoate dehydrogenase